MKKTFLLLVIIFCACQVSATIVRKGNNVIISQPVNEDLYIMGGTVTINAPIRGDLVIGGGTVVVNNFVTDDLIAGGGRITLNGAVGDDVRAAGGMLDINGRIEGDLAITGGTIIVQKKSAIQGNALIGGGTIVIDGTIRGAVKSTAGDLKINGFIEKEADCRSSHLYINGTINGQATLAAPNISIGPDARFYQGVRYWSSAIRQDFGQSVKGGKVYFDPLLEMSSGKWHYLGYATALGLIWYLTVSFIFILLIQYLFGNTMKKAANKAFDHTFRSMSYGALLLVALPVLIAVLMLTIVGIPIGFLLLIAYTLLLLFATINGSVIAANLIQQQYNGKWSVWQVSLIALCAFVSLKLLATIPVFGWLIVIAIVCISYGGLLISLKKRGSHTTAN